MRGNISAYAGARHRSRPRRARNVLVVRNALEPSEPRKPPKVVKPPRVPERWKSREPRKPRGRPGFGGVRAAVLQQSVAVRRALGAVLVCDPRVLPAPVVHCPALPARAAPERFGRSRARLLGTPIESACRVCLLTSNGLTGRTVPCTHAPLHVLLYAVACSVVCPVAHMIPRPSRHCRPELSFPRAR